MVAIALALLLAVQPVQPRDSTAQAAAQAARTPVLVSAAPAKSARGDAVTLTGEFPPGASTLYHVHLRRADGGAPYPDSIPAQAANGTTISFAVPHDLPFGTYAVTLTRALSGGARDPRVVGVATVRVVTNRAVRVDAISPSLFYPRDSVRAETLYVRGEGFSDVKVDNALILSDERGKPLCNAAGSEDCLPGDVLDGGRALRFLIPAHKYKGVMLLRVRVGDSLSQGDPRPVTFAQVSRGMPLFAAVLVLALLTGLVWLLARTTTFTSETSRARRFFRAVLIDEQTNTYSLSKFQLLLWTAATIFGYVYLSVARGFVQGNYTFADIPENLPGIILIAGSTTLLALGADVTRGTKGAGNEAPSLADFFTTGGVIAPERLQFFLWTIIGVGAFIVFTLSLEPGQIQTLPAIPERFLYMMGLSSFGYVGGKFVRRAGPTIDSASVTLRSAATSDGGAAGAGGAGQARAMGMSQSEAGGGKALVFEIHGTHLSPDATFRVTDGTEEKEISRDMIANNGRATVLVDDPGDPGFVKALQLEVTGPPASWATAEWAATERRLTLSNPDAQKAVVTLNKVSHDPPSDPPDDPPNDPPSAAEPADDAPPASAPPANSTTPPPIGASETEREDA